MKYRVLAGIIIILWLTAGCSGQPGGIEAELGREFRLGSGQTVSISGEPLQIKFAELIGDSRCPKNVVCVWAGEAACTVEITYQGTVHSKTLVQSGASSGYVSDSFQEYEIQFDVQPYPEAGKEIDQADYFLNLRIDKNR